MGRCLQDELRNAEVAVHSRVTGAYFVHGSRAATGSGRDRTIAAVLQALESQVRPNWLLVFDNAVQPLDLQRYLPTCPPGGHIIITSRLQNWPGYIEADSIEVSPFTEEEAISFLRRRVPDLGGTGGLSEEEDELRSSEAGRLAAALGHLPIAIEHAAAYLTETKQSVDDYLMQFKANAHRLLSEQLPEFSASVSATWTMSTALLTTDAEHLFNLCAVGGVGYGVQQHLMLAQLGIAQKPNSGRAAGPFGQRAERGFRQQMRGEQIDPSRSVKGPAESRSWPGTS